jgi:Deacetylase PdaC/Protein of unknown function (DUF3298)
MFQKQVFIALTLVSLVAACKNQTAPELKIKMVEETLKKCVRDSSCVEVSATLPQLEDRPDLSGIKAINDSLMMAVTGVTGGSLKVTMDTLLNQMLRMLDEQLTTADDKAFSMSYYSNADGKIIWNSAGHVSSAVSSDMFSGGAHGSYGIALATYNLNTGKKVNLTDIISDTTALRPLLEAKVFEQKKSEDNTIVALKDILFDPEKPLALPTQFCIVKEGVRFVYNPYEIMAYAFGMSDVVITWDELGKAAPRKQW